MSNIPSKEEIIKALKNPNTVESAKILQKIRQHPEWSNSVLCRCPLCGYETAVTNVHRCCPEAPATAEVTRPVYCYEHGVHHFVIKDGKRVWTTHENVPMYVVKQ